MLTLKVLYMECRILKRCSLTPDGLLPDKYIKNAFNTPKPSKIQLNTMYQRPAVVVSPDTT